MSENSLVSEKPKEHGVPKRSLNDIDLLRRYLCFGSEQGKCVVGNDHKEATHHMPTIECVGRLIVEGRGKEVVEEIVSFSVSGQGPRYGSVLLALAICVRSGDQVTKQAAYKVLNRVCPLPTHLFQFLELCQQYRPDGSSGWGSAHCKAISNWYQHYREEPLKLAQLVTKYRKRNNWSHKDVLRVAHLKPDSDGLKMVTLYIVKGLNAVKQTMPIQDDTPVDIVKTLSFLKAVEDVRHLGSSPEGVERVCEAIRTQGLVREHVPTQLLKSDDVWKALLVNMPLTALIRNLGKMTSMKMLGEGSQETDVVVEKLGNKKAIQYARIHPFNVLLAMSTYKEGHCDRGSLKWEPNQAIVKALDDMFYMSMKFVEPTGKRFLIVIDIGCSMMKPVNWSSAINCRQAAAALAMVTASREQHCEIVGLSETLKPINISPNMSLHEVMDTVDEVPGGCTDCAQPILWAERENKLFDVFVVFTDCNTDAGPVSPAAALGSYRRHSGISRAKLIVCALASNGFTLADPEDPDMLDMVGFDSSGPEIINTFITSM